MDSAAQIEIFPTAQSDWNPNTDQGKELGGQLLPGLSKRIEGSPRKPTNMCKVGKVIQEPQESPIEFLEHICET
jgi:hypothetical protein